MSSHLPLAQVLAQIQADGEILDTGVDLGLERLVVVDEQPPPAPAPPWRRARPARSPEFLQRHFTNANEFYKEILQMQINFTNADKFYKCK